jgi:hypothetical protein
MNGNLFDSIIHQTWMLANPGHAEESLPGKLLSTYFFNASKSQRGIIAKPCNTIPCKVAPEKSIRYVNTKISCKAHLGTQDALLLQADWIDGNF